MAQQIQSQKGTAAKKQSIAEQAQSMGGVEKYQQDRHHMIADAAYRIAEQRGFQGDRAMDDWLLAEAEVNARIGAKH